jgi:hypothetical protein
MNQRRGRRLTSVSFDSKKDRAIKLSRPWGLTGYVSAR